MILKPYKNSLAFGFTIVELVIYLAIFLALSIGAISLLFSLNSVLVQHQLKQELLVSGTTALERILLEVREADLVMASSSVLASTTAGRLSLVSASGDVTSFELTNGSLNMIINGTNQGNLVGENTTVNQATFYYYEVNGVELVRVLLDMTAMIGQVSSDWSLEGGAIVRGTYAN